MITSRLHGIIDYIVGFALIAAPWVFGFVNFEEFQAATYTPILIGLSILMLSLITNYEYSVAKIVSLKTHLMMDTGAALLLVASPWLFGFAEYVYLPHVLVGIAELGVVAITKNVAYKPKNAFVTKPV